MLKEVILAALLTTPAGLALVFVICFVVRAFWREFRDWQRKKAWAEAVDTEWEEADDPNDPEVVYR